MKMHSGLTSFPFERSYALQEVTKVFIGASAMMSNGTVLSRVGTVSTPVHCSAVFVGRGTYSTVGFGNYVDVI